MCDGWLVLLHLIQSSQLDYSQDRLPRTQGGMISEQQAWLDAAGRVPLLTPEEELHLGQLSMAAVGIDPLSQKRADLVTLRRAHRARERLATANLRLVYRVAERYRRCVPDSGFLDLLQAGAEGVMHAAGKFDPTKGWKFSTYSAWWIRQRIQVELDKHSRTIRAPSTITPQLRRLPRVRQQLTAELERPPTVEELATGLRLSAAEVVIALQRERGLASLDQSIDVNGDTTLGELQAAPGSLEEENDDQLDALRQRMAQLPAQQQRLVRAAYLPGEPTLVQQARIEGLGIRQAKRMVEEGLIQLRLLRGPPEQQLNLPLLLSQPIACKRRRLAKRRQRQQCQSAYQQLEFQLV